MRSIGEKRMRMASITPWWAPPIRRSALRRGIGRFGRWLLSPVERYLRRIVDDEVLRPLIFEDRTRLRIAETAVVNDALFNTGSGTITIEDYVFFGHRVTLIAGEHDYRRLGVERQHAVVPEGCDIVVRTGAWIATNATVLGPCVIGEHAVVAAGALVNKDVPPYAVVAGVPARVVGGVRPTTMPEAPATQEDDGAVPRRRGR